ncbi:MAG: HNH endonuclease [Phycisphaerae bacterium]
MISAVERKLDNYRQSYTGLSWREKVLLLVELTKGVKALGKYSEPGAGSMAARERIRLYLVKHVGIAISAAELEVLAGISEYAKRVRELRVEDGYKILTGLSNDEEAGIALSPREYLLIDPEPDHSAARRWHLVDRIKKQYRGAQQRILEFLKANVGDVVTTEELAKVSGDRKQYARRLRELRTEDGYAIASRFTGRPDLRVGEYILETLERVTDPHDRRIPTDVQKTVYRRDNNACRLCGWSISNWNREDPRILELHHLEEHAEGGKNALDNLAVLCSRCHDRVHSGELLLPKNFLNDG